MKLTDLLKPKNLLLFFVVLGILALVPLIGIPVAILLGIGLYLLNKIVTFIRDSQNQK